MEEQINLVDYINVIIKGKKIIFLCFLIGIFIATGLFFFNNRKIEPITASPTIYEVQSVIEVGTMNGRPIEDIANLTGKINYGFYKKSLDITAVHLAGTRLITLKIDATNQETAKGELTNAVNSILAEHDTVLNAYKDSVTKKIGEVSYQINRFMQMNQEAASLQIRVFNLADDLADASSSKKIGEPTVSAVSSDDRKQDKSPNLVFMAVVGAILGLLAGLVFIFSKEWWYKNKMLIKL